MILLGLSLASWLTARTEEDLIGLALAGSIRVWHDSNGHPYFDRAELKALEPSAVQPPLMVSVETTKRCPGCEEDVARSQFSRNARIADGLDTYCKTCTKDRRWEPRQLLPAAPIITRLRQVVGPGGTGAISRFGIRLATVYGGHADAWETQVGKILRGETEHISYDAADKLAMAVGGSAPEFWRTAW